MFSSYFNCFSSLEFLVHFFVFISKGFNSLCHKFLSSKSFSYFPESETLHNQHHCFKVFLLFYFEFLFNLKLSNNTFWFSICVNFIEFIVPTFKLCYYIICAFWKLLRWFLRQNTEISSMLHGCLLINEDIVFMVRAVSWTRACKARIWLPSAKLSHWVRMLSCQTRTTWQFNFLCFQSHQKGFCSSAPSSCRAAGTTGHSALRHQAPWQIILWLGDTLSILFLILSIFLNLFFHFLVCFALLAQSYFISGVCKGLKMGKGINPSVSWPDLISVI